tara:strand:+ start:34807 stop:35220 length:414 start_codon:yes stop_codon:yes gene_type:complete
MDLFYSWDLNLEKKASGFKEEDAEGKKAAFDPRKTRIPQFPTIGDALSKASFGQIFTTPKSKDIYVITKGTWGEKSENKVVKSFPPGTPYAEIKGFSERTRAKHGGKGVKSGEKGREEAGYATKDKPDVAKKFKPVK